MGQYIASLIRPVLLLGILAFAAGAQRKGGLPKPQAAPSTPASVRPLESGILSVPVSGITEAGYLLPVVAHANGWVRQVFFSEGDYIRGGQVMLKLFNDDMPSADFSRGYVTAPRNGFLVKKRVDVGAHVRAGTYVATLQDVSNIRVNLVVPPQVGQGVQIGDQVQVRITELPKRTFTGVIRSVTPQTSPRPSTVVAITVQNGVAPLIMPLMHANVVLKTQGAPPTMAKR
ncbi:efflux RND transporter periplasmic adaptor subunit [Hymenobacter sp. BT491]|uniref:efflux RND transporter periplasmic adaptor subunit n=1 Tax=Hymenobacter sp. BT491 TaxID=2766779 RepID=UPI001CA4122A|nr:efflux RND transporter periplasmic adaptor subunit [Hymenobacter sp. BT491]